MSDLTDEEIIATRRLHGLYDDLFREEKEIEIGEYVRTKDGHIAKYIEKLSKDEDVSDGMLFDNFIYEKYKNIRYDLLKEIIVKHSKELKDLIESGDLIIYRLRGLKHQCKGFIRIYKDARSGKENLGINNYSLEQVKIIKILTHQQFEANCYKVGEEDE